MANKKTTQLPNYDPAVILTYGGYLDISQRLAPSLYDSRKIEISDIFDLFGKNIYNTDGTLTGNRAIDLDSNDIDFNGGGNITFNAEIYTANVDSQAVINHVNGSFYLDSSKLNIGHDTLIEIASPDVKLLNETADTVLYLDSNNAIKSSSITPTELSYLSGATSNLQAQISALTSGVSAWKDPVLIAVDTNITLSGEQTIQSILTSTSRVLLWNQTNPVENGIWITSSGAWSRATDFDNNSDKISGSCTIIQRGDYAEHRFICSSEAPVVVGTDAINFINIPGDYQGTTNRITVYGNIIDIAATYSGQSSIITVGTISTGVWQGSAIADAYIASAATWNGYATSKERASSQASISASNIDWSAATHHYKTLSANTTFTFSNDTNADTIIIKIVQGASAYTVTWPSGVKWADGTEPTMSTTPGAIDVYTLTKVDGDILGSYIQNMS